jgi:MFS family permease
MFLGAFGLGNALVPASLLATTNVAPEDAGLAAGLLNTSFQVGGALGLAILSTLAASHTNHRLDALGHPPNPGEFASAFTSGFDLAFLVGIAFFVAAAVLVLGVLRKRHLSGPNTTIDNGRDVFAEQPR